jgi:putative SOS response-associated peptidase YedK
VLLEEPARRLWLDPALTDASKLRALLKPFDAASLECFPVSARVNRVANDDPELIVPLEPKTGPKRGGQLDLL